MSKPPAATSADQTHVTNLLARAGDGDPRATDALLPLVYDELRRLAVAHLSREAPGVTLQPTMLVHEAYLRLVGDADTSWNSRGHFFGAAAQAMRRILVDRARTNNAAKRGGSQQRIELGDGAISAEPGADTMLAVDELIDRLNEYDPQKARIVMLRYFAGLTVEQTAAALDMTPAAVKGEWTYIRAWMHKELGQMTDRGSRP